MKYFKLTKYITPLFETPDGIGSWFGYYNYDPLNHDQTRLLCQRTVNDAQVIKKGMTVEIGNYSLLDGSWLPIGVSDSYNYPQGCMVQWLPGAGNEKKVIYNLSKQDRLISRICDIETGIVKEIDWPIYGITPDGKKSIAVDLERSYYSIAYHYESVANIEKDKRIADGDGIFEINIENNTRRCIIPIEDIIAVDKEAYFDKAKHWLEHVMISTNGKRFCFLHRFSPINNSHNRITRLCVADIDGSNLQVIDGWRNFTWSHFGWDGDDAFSIYTYEKSQVYIDTSDANFSNKKKGKSLSIYSLLKGVINILPQSIRKDLRIRLKGQKQYYQYYKFNNGKFMLYEDYKYRPFDIDGHQNYTADRRYMICDSYPDERNYQRLIVYNKEKHLPLVVGEIYAGLNGKPGNCDLHPKLCKDNNLLLVDTAYNGKHHMKLFRLNWDLINKYFENK
jgi:hypothetical protein